MPSVRVTVLRWCSALLRIDGITATAGAAAAQSRMSKKGRITQIVDALDLGTCGRRRRNGWVDHGSTVPADQAARSRQRLQAGSGDTPWTQQLGSSCALTGPRRCVVECALDM